MEKVKVDIKYAKEIEFVFISDTHFGNPNSRVDLLKKTIKYISETNNCYGIFVGDMFDSILAGDRRLDLSRHTQSFFQTLEMAEEIFKPIKDKMLVALTGNHDYKLQSAGFGDPVLHLCGRLGIPYGGYSCFLKIIASGIKKRPIIMYLHHGFFAGRKRGGKVNNLEDVAQAYVADLYACGHSHDILVTECVRLDWTGDHDMLFFLTGSYLETASENTISYSERAGYRPQKLGSPSAIWSPSTGKLKGTAWSGGM